MTRHPVIPGVIQVRAYPVLVEAVERGVAYGWRRAFKHREDEPDTEVGELVRVQIEQAVLTEVCEWFSFPEVEE